MIRLLLPSVACIYFFELAFADPVSYISYSYPEAYRHHVPTKYIDKFPSDEYEYHIVPSDEYTVTELEVKNPVSVFDTISLPKPIIIIARIASCALSFVNWILFNSGFMALGAALLIGLCHFTSFCTHNITPSFLGHLWHNVPYLDDIEHFFGQAYLNYHNM